MAPFVETAEEQQDEELGPLPKRRHLRSKAKDAELPGLTSGYLGSPVVSIYPMQSYLGSPVVSNYILLKNVLCKLHQHMYMHTCKLFIGVYMCTCDKIN